MEFTEYEYGVDKKREGKLKLLAVALIALYVAFVGGTFGLLYSIRLIPVFAAVPVILWIIVLLTWRYVQIDDKYKLSEGKFSLTRKYGNRGGRLLCEFRIREALVIAPEYECASELSGIAHKRIYDARPSLSASDIYVAVFRDKDGERSAVKFQATEQAVKVLRYYNENTVVHKKGI